MIADADRAEVLTSDNHTLQVDGLLASSEEPDLVYRIRHKSTRPQGKVCNRCLQPGSLHRCEDGRRVQYLCAMCRSEMELLLTDRLKIE
ncbi:MAG: hypothetical protein ACYCW6_19250 [Candidatus Xenobia bacterium]